MSITHKTEHSFCHYSDDALILLQVVSSFWEITLLGILLFENYCIFVGSAMYYENGRR